MLVTKEIKRKIDEYFDNVTEEQLQKDLEKAGYHFYKNIKTPVLDTDKIKLT